MRKVERMLSAFLALVTAAGMIPSTVVFAEEMKHTNPIPTIESEQQGVQQFPEKDDSQSTEKPDTKPEESIDGDSHNTENPDTNPGESADGDSHNTENPDTKPEESIDGDSSNVKNPDATEAPDKNAGDKLTPENGENATADGVKPNSSAVMTAEEGTGDFVVEGGTSGVDYSFANGVLTILTGTQLTIKNASNTSTSNRIFVPYNVSANVIFAGINISTSSNSPFTLEPNVNGGAQATITLASGSDNSLKTTAGAYPALRAGETTTLVINSDNDEGKLTAVSGTYAAAIGGSDTENGGNITINGGIIEAQAQGSSGYGAAIGGGGCGTGGNITINGGIITTHGGYHGAGIGGGYYTSYSSTLEPPAINPNTGKGYSGNITINGGLTYSYGGAHGSAFGDGCVNPTGPLGYKIIVTGGTILPHLTQQQSWTSDLSALGGDVFVTGGSLKATSFQSAGKSVAYGDFGKNTEVFMTTISLEYLGLDKVGTTKIDNFELLIGGKKIDYGAPSYTDAQGNLYLWLPSDSQGKEVAVNMSVIDKTTGEIIEPDTFFITKVTNGSQLKQYSEFDVTVNEADKERLTKRYDGLPFDKSVSENFLNSILKEGIPVQNPAGGKLDNPESMTITARRLNDSTLEPDTNYENGALESQSDVGKYELVITSTQYANEAPFNDAYWGHRGYYKYAEITPADSNTDMVLTKVNGESKEGISALKPTDELTFEVKVKPEKGEAATCAAPTGFVQIYVDGKKYGKPTQLVAQQDKTEDGYNYSSAEIKLTLKDVQGIVFNNKNTVYVEYIPDANYKTSSSPKMPLNLNLIDIDINGDGKPDINIDINKDGKPDINIDTDGDLKPDINIDIDKDGKPDINIDTNGNLKPDINIDIDKDEKPDINIDTDNTGKWEPSGNGGNADGIWKPDTNIDTNGDGKPDKEDKRPPIDKDKDGVDDYWNPDKDVTVGDTIYETGDTVVKENTNGSGQNGSGDNDRYEGSTDRDNNNNSDASEQNKPSTIGKHDKNGKTHGKGSIDKGGKLDVNEESTSKENTEKSENTNDLSKPIPETGENDYVKLSVLLCVLSLTSLAVALPFGKGKKN